MGLIITISLFLLAQDSETGTSQMDEDVKVLAIADPALQESLDCEVVPDPMQGEQTWPTDEELKDAEGVCRQHEMYI